MPLVFSIYQQIIFRIFTIYVHLITFYHLIFMFLIFSPSIQINKYITYKPLKVQKVAM